MLLMWRKCKEESNMSSLSEVDSMMMELYKHVCVGGSFTTVPCFSFFPEMMIQEDPPMM